MRPFTCADAAAALGFPGATVALCREQEVLAGVYRVRLEGTPAGRLDRVVVVEEGVVSDARGGEALARFLRRSPLWKHPHVAAAELGEVIEAFHAWPPGFDRQSLRTVDERGKPVRVALPDLAFTLEGARRAGAGGGAGHPATKVRATLRGNPTMPLRWELSEQRGAEWVLVDTIAIEAPAGAGVP